MKTWFMHDMNCSQKDGFSILLSQKNGPELYGKFWLLQEFFYSSQLHKKFSETIRINESTLCKVLHTNRKGLGKVLEMFRECLGVLSETFQEPFCKVYVTTIPKSLNYISRRVEKVPDKSKSYIKKERESKSSSLLVENEKPNEEIRPLPF